MILARLTIPVVAIAAACATGEANLASPVCPSKEWQLETAAAGALALCIPPGFERTSDRESRATWQRVAIGATGLVPHDFFSIELVSIEQILEEPTPWPPSLVGDTTRCLADCGSTDSLVIHWDSVGSRLVRVEVGLANGGVAALRRQPILQSSWPVDTRHWVFFQGMAEKPSAFEQFRQALSTVRLVAPLASHQSTSGALHVLKAEWH